MSEQAEVWYIPGDEISFDLGTFEHEQHLLYVVAVYANAHNTEKTIELRGVPESVRDVSIGTLPRTWFKSRAVLSATIGEYTPSGYYVFQRLLARTYVGRLAAFELEPARMQQRGLPASILVHSEPQANPRLS